MIAPRAASPAELAGMLQGRVFHVTTLEALRMILEDQAIRSNQDRAHPSAFGYLANGFFRNRGYVSLFDYRQEETEEIRSFRSKCYPLRPQVRQDGLAVLFLAPSAYDSLVPWTRWREQQAWSEMVIPHVESGYPDQIPLDLVSEIHTIAPSRIE